MQQSRINHEETIYEVAHPEGYKKKAACGLANIITPFLLDTYFFHDISFPIKGAETERH